MASKTNWSASDIVVSFSAMAIALASIIISIWQGIEMRRHNRLSVRPRLEIVYRVDDQWFGYILINNGLGPAVISSKTIFVDDGTDSGDGVLRIRCTAGEA